MPCTICAAVCLLLGSHASAANNDQDLARVLAEKATASQLEGEVVRPFLLFSEAAKLDPGNAEYQQDRDKLAGVARLMKRTKLEHAKISQDIASARQEVLSEGGTVQESSTPAMLASSAPVEVAAAASPVEPTVASPVVEPAAPTPAVEPAAPTPAVEPAVPSAAMEPAVPSAGMEPAAPAAESVAAVHGSDSETAPKKTPLGNITTALRFRQDSAISATGPIHLTENRTYAYFDLNADLWSSKSGRYQVSFNGSVRGFYDSVFDLNHAYSPAVRSNEEHGVDLRRAVVSLTAPGWTVHAGLQQVVWGEAVGMFIADVVNPKDYRQFLIPDLDDVRIPLWAIDAEKSFGKAGRLELLWSPDEQLSRLPQPGSEFTFFTPSVTLPVNTMYSKPAMTFGNSRVGARYSWMKKGWDSSVFFLHSVQDLPATSTTLQATQAPLVLVNQRYPQTSNFAATTSKPLGDFVLKAEAIYTKGNEYETVALGPAVERDSVSAMLGFSYPLAYQYLLDVQYFQTSMFGSAPLLYEPDLRDGFSFRVADVASLRRFKPSLQAVGSVNQHDYWISPKLNVRLVNSLFLTVGFDWFAGNPQTQFGQLRNASRTELSLFWTAK